MKKWQIDVKLNHSLKKSRNITSNEKGREQKIKEHFIKKNDPDDAIFLACPTS